MWTGPWRSCNLVFARAPTPKAKTIDELLENIKEAILLCLEDEGEEALPEFIGVQRVSLG